ncbi:MAG: SoxR reducing system RseC family protein [Prevotella sp.]|nr:SoxR reducing system RseC family protein [Prevotella sp.]
MNNKIKHTGIVDSIEDGRVRVRIVQTAACAACQVASHCSAAEKKEKLVDIYNERNSQRLKVGDSVTVTASRQTASNALLIAFGLPFVVMVGVLFAVLTLTGNEGWAALAGILALLPYYGVVWLFRERLRQRLAFSIEA